MSRRKPSIQRGRSPSRSGDSRSPHDILIGVLSSVVLALVVLALAPYSIGLFKVITLATLFYGVAANAAE